MKAVPNASMLSPKPLPHSVIVFQVMQCFIFFLVTSVSTFSFSNFTAIRPAFWGFVSTWARHFITNIGFPYLKTPVLSKLLSKIYFHITRLVPPSLVIQTNFVPKLNWFINELIVTARISLSLDIVIGIPIWECSLTRERVKFVVIEKIILLSLMYRVHMK